jgi:hypothetical protein
MEMPQENSLCSYLKQAKMSLFSCFFKYKIGEQEGETGPAWVELVLVGRGKIWRNGEEGAYGANTVQTCM